MKGDVLPAVPYPGLRPFYESEAPLLFGRYRDAGLLAASVATRPVSVLYGGSGTGKSSLLAAGVVPRLQERPGLVVLHSEWGPGFLERLKDRVVDEPVPGRGSLELLDRRAPLDELLHAAWERSDAPVYLLLDQFEQHFLYSTPESHAFDLELVRAINRAEADVHVLFSLREDALGNLDRFRGRIANLLSDPYRLNALDRSAAREAVAGPIRAWAQAHDESETWIEPELAEAVVQALSSGSGADREGGEGDIIEPGFLQLVMATVWDAERAMSAAEGRPTVLRLRTLEELGGPARIVSHHIDRSLRALTHREATVAAAVLGLLITPSGVRIALTAGDLAELGQLPGSLLEKVLDHMVAAHILRTVRWERQEDAHVRYEVYHDMLVPTVLRWKRTRTAQVGSSEAERVGTSEVRALRRRVWVLGTALVMMTMLLLAMTMLWRRAERRLEAIEASRTSAGPLQPPVSAPAR